MTKFRIIFTLLLISLTAFCFAQIPTTNSLIKKLDNKQFIIVHGDKVTFTFQNKPAIQLIKRGTSVSEKLLAALNDPNKTIMAQLVLCHIYFKVATFAGPKTITENDKHVSKYFLGEKNGEGLLISEVKEGNSYKIYVEEKDRLLMLEYWKKKITKK